MIATFCPLRMKSGDITVGICGAESRLVHILPNIMIKKYINNNDLHLQLPTNLLRDENLSPPESAASIVTLPLSTLITMAVRSKLKIAHFCGRTCLQNRLWREETCLETPCGGKAIAKKMRSQRRFCHWSNGRHHLSLSTQHIL